MRYIFMDVAIVITCYLKHQQLLQLHTNLLLFMFMAESTESLAAVKWWSLSRSLFLSVCCTVEVKLCLNAHKARTSAGQLQPCRDGGQKAAESWLSVA